MRGITATPGDRSAANLVLITGAVGVAGRAIVDQLACMENGRRPGLSVVAVGRRRLHNNPRVAFVDGSDSHYLLGLTRNKYDALARNIRAVVHVASDSAVAGGDGVNLRVAREALDMCERAGAPFYYVSSAFFGARGKAGSTGQPGYPGPQVEGAAEPILNEAGRAGRVRYSVVRTSLVIGDSASGRIREFPALYQVIEAILGGLIPVDRLNRSSLLDFVPCDTVADVIYRLIEHNVADREVWLTAGEQALSIDQVLDVVRAYAKESGREVRHSRSGVSQSPFSSHRRVARRRTASALVELYSTSLAHTEPLESSLGDRFQNSLGELGSMGVAELPDARNALLAGLRYWGHRTEKPAGQAAVA